MTVGRCWLTPEFGFEHAEDVAAALRTGRSSGRGRRRGRSAGPILDRCGPRPAGADRDSCRRRGRARLYQDELRAALDVGADDVMRVPFEPEVLVARVAAGLRAARLRANEALLRSMVDNIPGALYRGACDSDWTMDLAGGRVDDHRLSRQ